MAFRRPFSISKSITWIAAVAGVLTAFAIPAIYGYTAYRYEREHVRSDARRLAQEVSSFIYVNPDTWRFQLYRIEERLGRYMEGTKHPRWVRLFDDAGEMLVEIGHEPPEPYLSVTAAVSDGFGTDGRLQVVAGVRDVWIAIGYAAVFGVVLGLFGFVALRVLPLRTLARALVDLRTEIARRRGAEATLRESEARFQALTNNSSAAIFLKDSAGRYLLVNKRHEEWYGVTLEEIEGKTDLEIFPKAFADANLARDRELMERRAPLEHEWEKLGADGMPKDFLTVRFPVFGEGAELVGIGGIISDITERKRAEVQLRNLSQAVDQSASLIVITDIEGTIEYVNPKMAEMTGYALEELIGGNPRVWKSADTPGQDHARLWSTITAGHDWRGELQNRRKDGSLYWVAATVSPVKAPDGTITHFIGVQEDITEAKRAEEAVQRSEEAKRAIFAASSDSIFLFDRDGTILDANEAGAKGFGRAVEEVIGQCIFDLMPPDVAAARKAGLRNMLDTAETVISEDRRDGRWFESRIHPILDDRGNVQRIALFARDVTERKDASRTIQTLNAAIEAGPYIVMITDQDAIISYVSPKFAEVTGYTREETIGTNATALAAPEQPKDVHEEMWRSLLADGQWHGEFLARKKNGESYRERATIVSVRGEDNALESYVKIAEDITLEKQQEEGLIQAQKMESVGQLTGGVAHDFNNLLTIIMGNLELAERAVVGDEALAKRVRSAMRAAQRGAELTHQLLAFSRRQALNPTVLDINRYVAGLEDMLRRTLGETVDIRFRLGDDGWRTRLDAGQLENALINLAVNARDAMPEGGRLTIETANVELDAQYAATHPYVRPGPYVMLAVSDTGAGIPAEIVDQVFEPFFTTKEKGKGTGLGLSMVYGFVKQSEGHVNVYSEPGQGTSVKLYFPRFDASDGAAVTMTSGPATAAGGTETILAVEDDEGVRETTELMLTSLGYRVLTAEDGRAALALLDERRDVDLVLTDVVMPGGMSGFDLGRAIGERFPGVKVAYVSGYAEHAVRGNGAMGDDVVILSKPYSENDLAARIRQALGTER